MLKITFTVYFHLVILSPCHASSLHTSKFALSASSSVSSSFIHSGYFYIASSNPLLLRGARPESRHSTDTVSEFHADAPQTVASKGLVQGPDVAVRAVSHPRPFGRRAMNLPMSHHAPLLLFSWLTLLNGRKGTP